jgi:hypothetical protein
VKRWPTIAVGLSVASVVGSVALACKSVVEPDILGNGKYGPHFECEIDRFDYGWPLTFLTRNAHARFQPFHLAADLGIILLATVAVTWLLSGLVRGQVTIKGLLVSMALLALPFSSALQRWRIHQAQVAYLKAIGTTVDWEAWQPFGPKWLRSLTGDRLLSWGDHLVTVDVDHSDSISEIPGKRNIKVLRIAEVRPDAMPSLDQFRHLIAIDMAQVNFDSSAIEGDDEAEFRRCLQPISNCETLLGLNLSDDGVINRDLQVISRASQLKHLDLSANDGIDDDGLVYLTPLRNLQKLDLWATGVTAIGVDKLRRALPHCVIEWGGDTSR